MGVFAEDDGCSAKDGSTARIIADSCPLSVKILLTHCDGGPDNHEWQFRSVMRLWRLQLSVV